MRNNCRSSEPRPYLARETPACRISSESAEPADDRRRLHRKSRRGHRRSPAEMPCAPLREESVAPRFPQPPPIAPLPSREGPVQDQQRSGIEQHDAEQRHRQNAHGLDQLAQFRAGIPHRQHHQRAQHRADGCAGRRQRASEGYQEFVKCHQTECAGSGLHAMARCFDEARFAGKSFARIRPIPFHSHESLASQAEGKITAADRVRFPICGCFL